MLRELVINNLALIESLNLVFSNDDKSMAAPGSLVVLTGETGAGKSIILQALNLLSACRASNTWIRTGAESASVEAFFEINTDRKQLLKTLEQKGFEADSDLTLKRIISLKGRSRYFINNSLANAELMEYVCENLFSVASQHEHQMLLNPRNHLDFIDSVGDLWKQRTAFGELFARWTDLKTLRNKLQQQEEDREHRRDLLSFQLKEIKDSAIRAGEDEELAAERKVLKSSDALMELGQMSYELLGDAVGANLDQVRKNLEQMETLDGSVGEIVERVTGATYEIEDLTRQLNQYLNNIPSDPRRLEEIEERIDLLQKLKRKYGGDRNLLSGVISYAENVEQELDELESMDQRLAEIEKDLAAAEVDLTIEAEKLSEGRRKTAATLEKTICRELKALSFAYADFIIDFQPIGRQPADLSPSGWDRVEFMFSANPGEPVKPLVKIASGGELSRLLLGLKCILASRDLVGTVIFDEVDAGIGGQAAEDIAIKIKQLASHHQVLCISHLPQIAVKADEHFRVEKSLVKMRTATTITLLDGESRITELARMLAGESVTGETIAFAKSLLEKGQK